MVCRSAQVFGSPKRAPRLYAHECERPDVSDYRFSTRHQEARKELPGALADCPVVDSAGRLLGLAVKAQAMNLNAVPFMSGTARFGRASSPTREPLRAFNAFHSGSRTQPSSPTRRHHPSSPYLSYRMYQLPDARPVAIPESRGPWSKSPGRSPRQARPSTTPFSYRAEAAAIH